MAQQRQLTHVRLEDCFGEEHLVEISTLPEDVQQAVQQQLEEKYGIRPSPIVPQKEPGTIGALPPPFHNLMPARPVPCIPPPPILHLLREMRDLIFKFQRLIFGDLSLC
jgi:hypothetical protein